MPDSSPCCNYARAPELYWRCLGVEVWTTGVQQKINVIPKTRKVRANEYDDKNYIVLFCMILFVVALSVSPPDALHSSLQQLHGMAEV